MNVLHSFTDSFLFGNVKTRSRVVAGVSIVAYSLVPKNRQNQINSSADYYCYGNNTLMLGLNDLGK